ncbi:hypothetical protein ABZV67_45345 [Streptomyces sp. NPDC005065]|uniref:hypothetical protein n=1 Tax=unclassified Streptomyces TaxID=2593676 RepID=UPI0033A5709E
MTLRSHLRIGSPLWLGLLLVCFNVYYYVDVAAEWSDPHGIGWAPGMVATTLGTPSSYCTGFVAVMAAWEAGRLARGGFWELAPARARAHVVARQLWPAVTMAWLGAVAPVAVSLVENRTVPDGWSLLPLGTVLVDLALWAVVGFVAGSKLSPLIAAPTVGVLSFLLVSTSVAVGPVWWRHIAGIIPETPAAGETYSLAAAAAPVLFTAGLAAAAVLLWVLAAPRTVRVVGALALVAAVTLGASRIVDGWGYFGGMRTQAVPMSCAGHAPEICVAASSKADPEALRAEVARTVEQLRSAGVAQPPVRVVDTAVEGRYPERSSAKIWHVPLTASARRGDLGYQVMRDAVRFPCRAPQQDRARAVLAWAAERTGQMTPYEKTLRADPFFNDLIWQKDRKQIDTVLALPESGQRAWFARGLDAACVKGKTA